MSTSARAPATRRLLTLLRWAGTLGALALIVRGVEWEQSLRIMGGASWPLVALAGLNGYVGIALSCLKWQALLRALDVRAGYGQLLRWYLIGSFASNLLPSDVGGDLGRAVYAGRKLGNMRAVVLSIFLERGTGLLGVVLLILLGGAIATPPGWPRTPLLLAGASALLGLAAAWRGYDRLGGLVPAVLRRRLPAIPQAGRLRDTMAFALLVSLIFHLNSVVQIWIVLRAVGVQVSPLPLLALVSAVYLVSALPIAIAGWGVREGAFVVALTPLGIPADTVLAAALITRTLLLLVTLPGGPLFLLAARAHSAPTQPEPATILERQDAPDPAPPVGEG